MNAISTLKSNASSGLYSPTQQNKQISENENSLEKAVPSEKIYATAQNYNVHSMSLDATISMSQELYDSGNISLMDHAILSFDPGRISGGSTMLTTPDQNGNYDLISEFKISARRKVLVDIPDNFSCHFPNIQFFKAFCQHIFPFV